jgi:hypothetical protein
VATSLELAYQRDARRDEADALDRLDIGTLGHVARQDDTLAIFLCSAFVSERRHLVDIKVDEKAQIKRIVW